MPKSLILFLTLSFCSFHLLGQGNIRFSSDSDTLFWYAYKNSIVSDYKLDLIETDSTKYVFRFWQNGLTIKLKKSSNNYHGQITRFVEQYPEKSSKKIFVQKTDIKHEDAYIKSSNL